MIYYDHCQYPVSSNDGYDSAVRIGIICMTSFGRASFTKSMGFWYGLSLGYEENGLLRRHPNQPGASNPKNMTRDNMLPLVAGFVAGNNHQACRRVFWSRLKSFFFMQNTERDKEGSTKYLRPHVFYKDSNPYPSTYLKGSGEYDALMAMQGTEHRKFDGPDPLLPNHIWFLIKASKLYIFYPFAIIGIPCFILTLIAHSLGNHNEENQMIAESYVNGKWALKLYRLINRRWAQRNWLYWSSRGEQEYHHMLIDFVNKQ